MFGNVCLCVSPCVCVRICKCMFVVVTYKGVRCDLEKWKSAHLQNLRKIPYFITF